MAVAPVRLRKFWPLGVVQLGVGAAASVFLFVYSTPRVSGAISSEGRWLGKWSWAPGSCASGNRSQFDGVSLLNGEEQGQSMRDVRIRRSNTNVDTVLVRGWGHFLPEPEMLISRDQCRRFDVSMERS